MKNINLRKVLLGFTKTRQSLAFVNPQTIFLSSVGQLPLPFFLFFFNKIYNLQSILKNYKLTQNTGLITTVIDKTPQGERAYDIY